MSFSRELIWVVAGRSAGLVVNLLFLPLYSVKLGPTAFGQAALVLALVALLALFDLGTSQCLNQELGQPQRSPGDRLWRVRVSGRLLASATVLCLPLLVLLPTRSPEVLLCTAGLVGLQWQWQLQLAALQASQHFRQAAWLNVGGQLLRAAATWLALSRPQAGLMEFLLAQALLTAPAWWATRLAVRRLLNPQGAVLPRVAWADVLTQLRQSRALVWSGLVGALATQLDKPLISTWLSPGALAPYFLATTLAAAPLSLLGAPLAQYLQARMSTVVAQRNRQAQGQLLRFGFAAALFGVSIPCLIISWSAEPIVGLWLRDGASAPAVAALARILLLGYAIAGIGYIPFAIVMAHGDFGFQSRWATTAMLLQMVALAGAAWAGSVTAMCWAWVGYFGWATLGLAWRARWLLQHRTY